MKMIITIATPPPTAPPIVAALLEFLLDVGDSLVLGVELVVAEGVLLGAEVIVDTLEVATGLLLVEGKAVANAFTPVSTGVVAG